MEKRTFWDYFWSMAGWLGLVALWLWSLLVVVLTPLGIWFYSNVQAAVAGGLLAVSSMAIGYEINRHLI